MQCLPYCPTSLRAAADDAWQTMSNLRKIELELDSAALKLGFGMSRFVSGRAWGFFFLVDEWLDSLVGSSSQLKRRE